MEFELQSEILLWGFFVAFAFGAIANRSNFCTMGAVSDWVNFGDLSRMRSWFLAIAVAVIGIGVLEYLSLVDMDLTTSNDTSTPPFRVANFVWLRHLLGGLLFGIGMTLASGCGNKTLVRIGEGNMKSLVVLVVMGVSASVMLFTSFDYYAFLQWMTPVSLDFSNHGINSQDLGGIAAGIVGSDAINIFRVLAAIVLGGVLLTWVLKSADFRGNGELLVAGALIGVLILVAWYINAGPTGQAFLEELEFADERPYASGAQSLSFVGPSAHATQYLYRGFPAMFLTFGLITLLGILLGSFVYTLVFRKVRIEWFASASDFFWHIVGGTLMGIGGVLGMGCTIGQGISGMATLALGSIVTIVSIITGSALTMKYQYYRMMQEDD